MQEVSAVCDEVLIIAHGQLVAQDTPDNLGRHVTGSNTLDLTVKAPDYRVKAMLTKLPEVSKFEIHDSTDIDCVDVLISCDITADIREKLFNTFAAAKCPILRMTDSNLSLEDVFIKVTAGRQTDKRSK